MKRERRSVPIEIRADGTQPGVFEAVVVRYDVLDDYNTRFRPGCFTESLQTRLPRITWGHDWLDVIGRYVDFVDTDTELTLVGQLDDFDAVPRARQAYAQLQSGTIDQFSVGFCRLADELVDPDLVEGREGVYDIVKAELDEAALVLAGAVPGTRLLSVRSGATVPVDVAGRLAARLVAGDIDAAEFFAGIKDAADPPKPPPPVVPPETPPVVPPAAATEPPAVTPPAAPAVPVPAPTLEQLVAAGDLEGAQALLAAELEAEAVPPPPVVEPPPATEPAADVPSEVDIDAALALAGRSR